MKKLSAHQYAEVFVEAMTKAKAGQRVKVARAFVAMVAQRRAWKLVPRILEHVQALDDARHRVTRVQMTTADAEATKTLTAALKQALGNVAVESSTNAALIAGSTIRIGDTLLDTSLAHQLNRLQTQLSHE